MTSSLAQMMTRCPRIFDAGQAEEMRSVFADLESPVVDLIAGAASAAPYLQGLAMREADWLREAVADPSEALGRLLWSANAAEQEVGTQLRQGKRRLALLTGLADLGGAWSLEQVTGALTDFAGTACQTALREALRPLLRRGKVPGMTEGDLGDLAGMVVLAMGKMGAHELNYSSDIDLICLFDETRFAPDDFMEARTAFVRATRNMCATLSDLTGDGYVFRTDLRLRPDPAVTPVCMAMEAAERYYESLGRTWERAAYIKARPCAGSIEAGNRFLTALRPFVWRKHLDFAAIQDAHDMRLAIREHKGLGGAITLPGHDMKLGRGGIREIEFFTQTRQLIAGGRDPALRVKGTCEGLALLSERGWVGRDVAEILTGHYRAHRTVEHRIQMVRDAQTHAIPRSDEGFARIAALMDMDVVALDADLRKRLEDVHALTEGFFSGTSTAAVPLNDAPVFDGTVIERWQSYPAFRSERARELFEQLKPDLLTRLAQAAKPDEALLALDGFLAGLPAGVQLFSLLKANPQLGDLLVETINTSPALAQHLSRNAGVFDAVIGGDFFSEWPGQAGLTRMLGALLEQEPDYEAQLDGTRRWAREWHFRVGVHMLRGLIDARTASRQYADLARAVLAALWPVVTDQFALRHGPPPGRGAIILGMGSLGAGHLTATSDLDLLVIYDPADQESSEGKRPLAARTYYARLTQAMITAMTAPMAQGKLYEIDMRLRPSGNQGPVATSLVSFGSYQREEAWVWEHLALTRASVVAGPERLGAEVSLLCADILKQHSDKAAVLADVAEMRQRIASAKAPDGPLDAKIGPGRSQDIELFAQAGALIAGTQAYDIDRGLEAAVQAGFLTAEGLETLKQVYAHCWTVQCAARLLSPEPVQMSALGEAAAAFLARTAGMETVEALAETMEVRYAAAEQVILTGLKGAEDAKGG